MENIFLTGHEGYIGSVLYPKLVEEGHSVTCCDIGYYRDEYMFPPGGGGKVLRKDIRDLDLEDLNGIDTVIHLAALSNDAVGNVNTRWTDAINLDATVKLARSAKAAGARRFIFSSSCIIYGLAAESDVDETTEPAPETAYARTKVEAEAALTALADENFCPVYLRNGTIYGPSAHMRLDTVLNSLTASAVTTGKVVVRGDGAPWRPVCHVEDVARYFLRVLAAPASLIQGQAFNCGNEKLNYRVRDLADIVSDITGVEIEYENRIDEDQRSYKARFEKFGRAFPDFKFKWTARTGVVDLANCFRRNQLTIEDFNKSRFYRLPTLRRHLDAGILDDDLRFA